MALVVTVIILLILAGVSINLVLGQNGLIAKAKEARDKSKNATNDEAYLINGTISDYIKDQVGENDDNEIKRNGKIPSDGEYTIKATGTVLTGSNGDDFPENPSAGDTYTEGDYIYTYNKGDGYGTEWCVKVNWDKEYYDDEGNFLDIDEITEFGEIVSEIAGKPMTHMTETFEDCWDLLIAPKIPQSVTNMNYTFGWCHALVEAPKIPNNVVNMEYTFSDCTDLSKAPEIPDSVTNMDGTFYQCESLIETPIIPESVTSLSQTFLYCKSLVDAPKIPKNVTNLKETFKGCSALKNAPEIPSSVTNMYGTFWNCISLTGSITINANLDNYDDCFSGTTKPITLTGTSTKLEDLKETVYPNDHITILK